MFPSVLAVLAETSQNEKENSVDVEMPIMPYKFDMGLKIVFKL